MAAMGRLLPMLHKAHIGNKGGKFEFAAIANLMEHTLEADLQRAAKTHFPSALRRSGWSPLQSLTMGRFPYNLDIISYLDITCDAEDIFDRYQMLIFNVPHHTARVHPESNHQASPIRFNGSSISGSPSTAALRKVGSTSVEPPTSGCRKAAKVTKALQLTPISGGQPYQEPLPRDLAPTSAM
jgi:hypothetical protein